MTKPLTSAQPDPDSPDPDAGVTDRAVQSIDPAAPTQKVSKTWDSTVWAVAVVLALIAGVVARFLAQSPLWLDEAQSVAIARLPLTGAFTLFDGLRQDGSPPLYYLILHFWIEIFGDGDVAVRTLSAVLNLACLVPLWFLARQVIGVRPTRVAMLVFVTSPFVIYFGSETRMYSLLLLLTMLGGLALVHMLKKPSWGAGIGLALASGAVALTHYWSLYLLFSVGLLLLLAGWRASTSDRRRNARLSLLAMLGGIIVFLPYLPAFLYQAQHTGTPWGKPASFAAVVHAFGQWSGGPGTAARILLVLSCALLAFAVFGTAAGPRQVLLDLKGSEPGRLLLLLSIGTLVVAVAAGQLVGNAWADRYTAAAFVPYLLCLALGTERLVDAKLVRGAVAGLGILGLAAAIPNVVMERTQAGEVASILAAKAKSGDVVLYCPDQLGPAIAREIRGGQVPAQLKNYAMPGFTPPDRVNWVDYKQRYSAADRDPGALVDRAIATAGNHQVWLVYSDEYLSTQNLCIDVRAALFARRPGGQELRRKTMTQSYEHEELYRFFLPPRRQ